MQLSVELTLYPLREDYREVIREAVEHLHGYEGVEVRTFATASILVGEFDRVMEVLKDLMNWSQVRFGKCVYVAKFLPDYVAQ